MIEIRNLKLPLSGVEDPAEPYGQGPLRDAVARRLKLTVGELGPCSVARRSVDARGKGDVNFVATALVHVQGLDGACEASFVQGLEDKDVALRQEPRFSPPVLGGGPPDARPVVVGAGAAGLFCALALAEGGCGPILIERGRPPGERSEDVRRFNETGVLDESSNIQFGAGGAGTFSDGKLTTGTTSPAHSWILRRFVEAGAHDDILWQAKPHIGSDVLPQVVDSIVHRVEECGGLVRWGTRLTGMRIEGGRIQGIECEVEDRGNPGLKSTLNLDSNLIVLACGHSARDVFILLKAHKVILEPKVFSIGARIEHSQAAIDRAQYGKAAGNPALGAADYKLSWHDGSGRGVYTFCMCPGGTVVAASSEAGGVVTNGMSAHARDGANANAAVLVNVFPQDIPGLERDVLAGIGLQRRLEAAAFSAGGGAYVAPAQLVGDFLRGQPSRAAGSVAPTYPRGVAWTDLGEIMPQVVREGLRAGIPAMARRLRGFDAADAVLTGLETRSSSPLRITRGGDLCSLSVDGLYPCGEGAGYAGGIMSAATDGLRCARAVVERLNGKRE